MTRKISGVFLMAIVVVALSFAGCSSNSSKSENGSKSAKKIDGKAIFQSHCKLCHGADGTLGLNGAANLAQSTLSKQELVNVVTNGRRMMQPYKSVLSKAQIDAVTDYVMTLRK